MEGVFCKTSAADTSVVNTGAIGEVIFPKKTFTSKDITETEKNEKSEKKENLDGVNGSESPRDTELTKISQTQKTTSSSPTLIGSAFKVMKNLFSPEKAKSKHSSVLSPITQQKNAAGPPCGSVCLSGKTELFCTEPGPHSGENLKHNFQINEIGQIQSPLPMDNLSNTDESFLTTVSLIDDSFHSAVTDFDDNGDPKVDSKVATVLAKSHNLDSVDPCNDTLETNESYLENTTLKIGTPEGKSDSNISTDGTREVNSTQSFIIKTDDYSGRAHEHDLLRKEGKLNNTLNGSTETAKTDTCEKIVLEGVKTPEKVEMANLFLNKSFEKSSSQQSGISVIDFGSFVADTWKKIKEKEKGNEILLENPNNEAIVGDSISTTTVVLDTHQEIDNMSHEAGDFEIHASSQQDDNATLDSSEVEKSSAPDRSLNSKQHSDSCDRWRSPAGARLLTPQKKCVGDGNSPSNRANALKIKLNKSDELINRRTSSEPADGKNNCSVDISLMKNVESSELSEEFVLNHQSEVGKAEVHLPANKREAAAVASQLSYTILINHNNVLNRPVVDSSSFSSPGKQTPTEKAQGGASSDLSFNRTSKMKQSTPLSSGNKEKGRSVKSPSRKHCSPELKDAGNRDMFPSGETPKELSPVSPGEGKEFLYSVDSDLSDSAMTRNSDDLSHPSSKMRVSPGKGSQTKNDKKTESPPKKRKAVTPTIQRDGHRLNSTFDKSPVSPRSKKCNSTFFKGKERRIESEVKRTSPEPAQLNKTYDKLAGQLNQTFDLKDDGLEVQKLNETFDRKQRELPLHSKIDPVVGSNHEKMPQEMNKTFDSVPIAETSQSEEPGPENTGTEAKATDVPSKEAEPKSNALTSEVAKSDSSKDYESPASSKNSISLISSDLSTALLNDDIFPSYESIDFAEKQEKTDLTSKLAETISLPGLRDSPPDDQVEEKLLSSLKEDKLQYDPELVQLIQEQFSSNDIEKICSVVQDFSSLKLSNDIIKASEQFDKSFHGTIAEEETEGKQAKPENPLSPKSFDFLSSIGGKASGRDWSRESLYVKFDPLVQPSSNSLIDFTKEGEALPPLNDSPVTPQNTSICEQLLNISPQKKTADIVPPLTPLSHKAKADEIETKNERLKELQNEIYFLKNLYAEREKTNKTKMEEAESQVSKLTGDVCFLEDKLREASEREKSLVKKVKEQTQSIGQLNVIMQEYVNVISKMTSELENLKAESARELEGLSLEKDSYMTHLQNTEAAFTDVHTKYEKSKKTIASLKANEAMFRNTIAEQAHKLEDLMAKAKEAEDKASVELQKAHDSLSEAKANHLQENARLRAQLRKTELKVEALQESLDQKVKENRQLTAICDELIEGKK